MPDENDQAALQRISPFSDIWPRYFAWGAPHTLSYIHPILVAIYCVVFYSLSGSMRQGVMANMRALFPRSSWLANCLRGFRVFWNYAMVGLDGAWSRKYPRSIEWEIVGLSHLDQLRAWPGGAIMATAHMGNYDLAATAFAERLGRPMHVVRAPERTAKRQESVKQNLAQATRGAYQIVYNEPGAMLGVTLAQALQNGGLVAVQADRVLFEVSSVEAEWEGRRLRIPQGPFVLALTTRCPIFPIFIIRLGCQRYRIEVREPIWCQRQGRDNRAAIQEAAQQWANILGDMVWRHWDQWMIVEPAFVQPSSSP